MLILELVINDLAAAKLADRDISDREIEEVVANGPLVRENPRPRVGGSMFVIGLTDVARFLTVVLSAR